LYRSLYIYILMAEAVKISVFKTKRQKNANAACEY
jgi:hypothetical protein